MMTLKQERLLKTAEKEARAIQGRHTGDEIQVTVGDVWFWFIKVGKKMVLIQAEDWDAPTGKRGRPRKQFLDSPTI